MDYSKYLQVADFVLDKIETIDPNCIVAGGMPRDIDNGKPVRDIDLFFYVDHMLTNNQVNKMLTKLGFDIISQKTGKSMGISYKLNPLLQTVYDVNINATNVQLMRMSKPVQQSVICTFPLSISQCYYKDGKIETLDLYKRCKARKVIVRTNQIYNNEHEYLQKILAKYSDWEYLG